ncbi:thiamine pyrophosphate-binding protein [Amycolatopsis rhabdoformis]|uniref:Thiamine pyrophosphate-binding protein n=1 Tax=Amycolatopsis rhabdoformis TaxID=1448059 RepID=A0ABZ1IAY4_9PSEU|nr:thiamine pyrophosphate-binding protein [Amycolatopsis rhabdoformis]WSE31621.1 thiamine pyrophosphate-binding protein [Amycolatopsis rhabdoformis]
MKGYEAIPELLRRGGTTTVFSMVGNTNVPWIGHGLKTGALRLVKTRHEETAVNAAEGYSRSRGEIPVCSVTQGPGFANALNGLVSASRTHVPMLFVVGESPATKVKTTMNIDQRALCAIAGVGFHHVAFGSELEDRFTAALAAARWNGVPQVLSIADGVLAADVELAEAEADVGTGETGRHGAVPDAAAIESTVDLLASARRPLVLAGQGALLADCGEELAELAGLVGAQTGTTLRANWFFAGREGNLGLCGNWAPALVRKALAEVDVVFAVGASLNTWTTGDRQVFPAARFVRCDVDPATVPAGADPEVSLFGDAKVVVRAVLDAWRARGFTGPKPVVARPTVAEVQESVRAVDVGHDPARGLDLREVFTAFDEHLPANRVVVTDAGRSLKTLPTLVGAESARQWLIGNSFGSIGRGLGIAVGAAAARPADPVVLFCGDGGFMMAAQDLDAVRLNGLSLTVVVTNDEQLGAEVKYVDQYDLPPELIRQTLPDVTQLAAAFGGTGRVVRTREELAEAAAGPRTGLTVLDVRIDPAIDCAAALK